MFNVCAACGSYRVDKEIVSVADAPNMADAVCPECGHTHRFRRLPLLIVAGASGTGKSVICQRLASQVSEAVLLEADILWCPAFNTPDDNYRDFGEIWLRMAKNIAQAGKPVVLFGAGLGVPENLERCVERRYVGTIHRLALTAPDDVLTARLRARPAWRGCDEDFIAGQLAFNRWFVTTGPTLTPPMSLINTAAQPIDATAAAVQDWIHATPAADPATARSHVL